MPHRRAIDTEPMDRILLWAVQLQGQWRSISTELPPDRHRRWPPLPSQRSGGCSTVTEEREVSWSQQHPSRTGPSRWRGCNHCTHNKIWQTGEWPTPWTQSLVITLPKKGSLQHCKNCGLWTLSCDFAHTINETLKWLTQLSTLMQNHSGDDSVTNE